MRVVALSLETLFLFIDFILVPHKHVAYLLYQLTTALLLGWYFNWVIWSYQVTRAERELIRYGEKRRREPPALQKEGAQAKLQI